MILDLLLETLETLFIGVLKAFSTCDCIFASKRVIHVDILLHSDYKSFKLIASIDYWFDHFNNLTNYLINIKEKYRPGYMWPSDKMRKRDKFIEKSITPAQF